MPNTPQIPQISTTYWLYKDCQRFGGLWSFVELAVGNPNAGKILPMCRNALCQHVCDTTVSRHFAEASGGRIRSFSRRWGWLIARKYVDALG